VSSHEVAEEFIVSRTDGRFEPLYPRLRALASKTALPFAKRYFKSKHIYRASSAYADECRRAMQAPLARGKAVYLAGIGLGGFHNSGVALIAIDPLRGPEIICNNEEERFSGHKHANHYPDAALDALVEMMDARGLKPGDIHAWLGTFDLPVFVAGGIGTVMEELPASTALLAAEVACGLKEFCRQLFRTEAARHTLGATRSPAYHRHAASR
jgi:carbamoyltransferase